MLLIVSLFACVAWAGDYLIFKQNAKVLAINPAPGAGNWPDGGNVQGLELPSSAKYLVDITGSEAAICFHDAGSATVLSLSDGGIGTAVYTGCNDGGSCANCASGGRWFSPGKFKMKVPVGGMVINARSDGGARIYLNPLEE